jgi:thiamine-monophosphate kinase
MTRLGPGAEFDLIRRFLAGAAPPDAAVGPGDDAAVLRDGVVLTVDLSIEDVHFRRAWLDAEEVGWRAAVASLSDLAAMAAQPVGLLLSLAVPEADAADAALRLATGVRNAAEHAGCALLGGDLTRSPGPWILDIVGVGRAQRPVLRSGARPGDALFVTGQLGGAAAAVRAWRAGREPEPDARAAFARPLARIAEACWLAERASLHALLDLSDGLAGDAAHIAAASDVGIVLDADAIPVHPAAASLPDALDVALSGGEDYELCFAAPSEHVEREREAFERNFGLRLTRVGSVVQGAGVRLRSASGAERPLAAGGFQHFTTENR